MTSEPKYTPPAIHPHPGIRLIAPMVASKIFEPLTWRSLAISYPIFPNEIALDVLPITLNVFGITFL